MTKVLKIFDTVAQFNATAPSLLASRAQTDLLLVNIDRPNVESFDPDNMPSEDHGKLCLRRLEGTAMTELLTGPALMSAREDEIARYAEASFSKSGEHPVDICFEKKLFHTDSIVIVIAGVVEWITELLSTRLVLRHLPDAAVYLLTCDCATERKIAMAGDARVAGKIAGIIFTSECECVESPKQVEAAFVAAATTPLN